MSLGTAVADPAQGKRNRKNQRNEEDNLEKGSKGVQHDSVPESGYVHLPGSRRRRQRRNGTKDRQGR